MFIPSIGIIINIIIIFLLNKFTQNRKINIYIGNSFKGYYQLPKSPITCLYNKRIYKCYYINKRNVNYDASIYNGNRKFPKIPNTTYNIIMTIEKLSQVSFMKNVGEGKNKYYQLAVDYRSFNNKWHISRPLFPNIYRFISISQSNFKNISTYMMRSNAIVYIQKVGYKNRQYIVKQIMKHYPIHSYGKDLNNHKWPNNILRSNKVELLKNYRFCLAIENSVILWKRGTKFEATEINNDYITEKLLHCLLAGSIPIYFGPKNVNEFLPHPHAIINLRDYKSIENLTNYIKNVNNNVTLLKKHTSWHYNYSKEWLNKYKHNTNIYCRICNYVKLYSPKVKK